MILKFGRNYLDQENLEIIAEPKTIKEAFAIIIDRLKKRKFDYHCLRSCLSPEYLLVDYGSWSNFFFIDDLPEDIEKQWNDYTEEGGRV